MKQGAARPCWNVGLGEMSRRLSELSWHRLKRDHLVINLLPRLGAVSVAFVWLTWNACGPELVELLYRLVPASHAVSEHAFHVAKIKRFANHLVSQS